MFGINLNIHHYHHYPELANMIQILEDVRAQVERNTAIDLSAIALIQGLVQKIDALAANATELNELKSGLAELTSSLTSSSDGLAAAVAANTPADPSTGGGDETPAPPADGGDTGGDVTPPTDGGGEAPAEGGETGGDAPAEPEAPAAGE